MDIVDLIRVYQSTVKKANGLLIEHTGCPEPMCWREYNISPKGEFGCNDEYSYAFHGIGCQFVFHKKQIAVDFDYGYQGRIDGFNLWNLWEYLGDAIGFKNFSEKKNLEFAFQNSVEQKIIVQKYKAQQDDLYYLYSDVDPLCQDSCPMKISNCSCKRRCQPH